MDVSIFNNVVQLILSLIQTAMNAVNEIPKMLNLPADLTQLYLFACLFLGLYALAEGAKKVLLVVGLLFTILAVIKTILYLVVR
jgi:hypothetical protein